MQLPRATIFGDLFCTIGYQEQLQGLCMASLAQLFLLQFGPNTISGVPRLIQSHFKRNL